MQEEPKRPAGCLAKAQVWLSSLGYSEPRAAAARVNSMFTTGICDGAAWFGCPLNGHVEMNGHVGMLGKVSDSRVWALLIDRWIVDLGESPRCVQGVGWSGV